MKTKNYILFFLLCINLNAVYSQVYLPKHLSQVFAPITQPPVSILTNCNIPSLNGCSYVRNDPFQPNTSYDPNIASHRIDPFNFNGLNTLITDWEVATGTPTVWSTNPFFGNYPLPPNGLNYFFGATGFDYLLNERTCESVVQKIPTLSTAKTYVLSFQKMYKSWLELPAPYNTDFPLYSFRIVLMRCQDYNQTFLPQSQISYKVPNLPAISQTIYCEIDVHNPNWQQVFFKFTPNQNYDLMWIFPSGDPNVNRNSGLLVTQPELIDVTNFSAGNNPTPTSPSCIVTIGPATPNCAPAGAVFKWTGPQGQTPTVPANQQITFNASIPGNAGIWTLSMTMPNAVVTNSSCGIQQPIISASVNVPYCPGPCTSPTISPAGPIDYYTIIDNKVIGVKLTSSTAIGNQWYYNNQAIVGQTGDILDIGNYSGNQWGGGEYFAMNGNCSSNRVTVNFYSYGYGYYGEQIYNLGSKSYPVLTPSWFCPFTNNVPLKQFNLGTNATYSWNIFTNPGFIPNVTIASSNPNSYQASLNIGPPSSEESGSPNYGNAIQSIATLNGLQKIIDFQYFIYKENYNKITCPNTTTYWLMSSSSSYNYQKPGGSSFDWEDYDFGPNSTIIYPTNPVYFITPNKLHIPGGSQLSDYIKVNFSAPSTVKKEFYDNNLFGACYKENIDVTFGSSCLTSEKIPTDGITIYPNPASNQITITSKEIISTIEIFDLMNPSLKRINVNGTKSPTINVSDLKPGIYNCKITTSKGTQNQKLIIKR